MENKCFKNQSFTMIELLLVITIIGLIISALILLINPKKQMDKAWDMQRKYDLSVMKKVFEEYNNDRNVYPSYHDVCFNPAQSFGDECSCSICGLLSISSFTPYLSHLHCDPQHPQKDYQYIYNCGKQTWFKICATLSTGEIFCTNSSNTDQSVPIWLYTSSPTPTPTPYIPISSPTHTATPPPLVSTSPTPTTTLSITPTPHPYTSGSCINQEPGMNCQTYCQSIGKICGRDHIGHSYHGFSDESCSTYTNGCISYTDNPQDSPCCTSWPFSYTKVRCICW